MGKAHITKAKRIARAYEEAGFLTDATPMGRLQQLARWAGITVSEAQAFANMVENKRTLNGLKPETMPGDKIGY